jgi:hypothetical protein
MYINNVHNKGTYIINKSTFIMYIMNVHIMCRNSMYLNSVLFKCTLHMYNINVHLQLLNAN